MNTIDPTRRTSDKKVFRFLYGRWIRWCLIPSVLRILCSDSSMVDEYAQPRSGWKVVNRVQIPLWSMNTQRKAVLAELEERSDSSMVDEYGYPWKLYTAWHDVQIPLWSMNTRRAVREGGFLYVQIPLWSMNTRSQECSGWPYWRFRFLYGRWIPLFTYAFLCGCPSVQIPLWSMNTTLSAAPLNICSGSDSSMVDEYGSGSPSEPSSYSFRFLYGRWIRAVRSGRHQVQCGSDSSMVDEYHNYLPACALVQVFRFLYGRWIQVGRFLVVG